MESQPWNVFVYYAPFRRLPQPKLWLLFANKVEGEILMSHGTEKRKLGYRKKVFRDLKTAEYLHSLVDSV